MTRAVIAEARAFQSWHDYQEALTRAIAPLSEEQLQRRLLPGLRTPGEIAEHIVFGRALDLHRTLGEEVEERPAWCGRAQTVGQPGGDVDVGLDAVDQQDTRHQGKAFQIAGS